MLQELLNPKGMRFGETKTGYDDFCIGFILGFLCRMEIEHENSKRKTNVSEIVRNGY